MLSQVTKRMLGIVKPTSFSLAAAQLHQALEMRQLIIACDALGQSMSLLAMYRTALETLMRGIWWLYHAHEYDNIHNAYAVINQLSFTELLRMCDADMGTGLFENALLWKPKDGIAQLREVINCACHGDALAAEMLTLSPRRELEVAPHAQLREIYDEVVAYVVCVYQSFGFRVGVDEVGVPELEMSA